MDTARGSSRGQAGDEDWKAEMKRVRLHFTLAQFKFFLDCLEDIIKKNYGGIEVEVRDRQIDTFVPAPHIKVRNL